jgi:hypothetical protein
MRRHSRQQTAEESLGVFDAASMSQSGAAFRRVHSSGCHRRSSRLVPSGPIRCTIRKRSVSPFRPFHSYRREQSSIQGSPQAHVLWNSSPPTVSATMVIVRPQWHIASAWTNLGGMVVARCSCRVLYGPRISRIPHNNETLLNLSYLDLQILQDASR